MDTYGLSPLEVKHLIEQALLPDRCTCEIHNAVLTLSLISVNGERAVEIPGVRLDSLNNSRAIARVIGEARYQLSNYNADYLRVARKR